MGYFQGDADTIKQEFARNRQESVDPVRYNDPHVSTKIEAARDMGREAASMQSANERTVDVPELPQQGGAPMPFRQYVAQNFPDFTQRKFVRRGELQQIQGAYQNYVATMKAAQGQGQQRFKNQMDRAYLQRDLRNDDRNYMGGKAPNIPGNLAGQMGLAAMRPDLYGPKVRKELAEIGELVYGKEFGPGGTSTVGKKGSSKSRSTAKGGNVDQMGGFMGNREGMAKILMGNAFDVPDADAALGGEAPKTGFLQQLRENPVKTYFEMKHFSKMLGAIYDPNDPAMAEIGQMKGTIDRLLDTFRPDPGAVLDAVDDRRIDEQQADRMLRELLKPEELGAILDESSRIDKVGEQRKNTKQAKDAGFGVGFGYVPQ